MDNLEDFKTLLEIIVLILTLATQSPLLGIIAAVGFGSLFFIQDSDKDEEGNEDECIFTKNHK